jgi:hypothetical protein
MKLFAAFLVVTPFMLTAAHADGDGDRQSRIQKSIYEVAAGEYPRGMGMYEGRSAAYGPAPGSERGYLGPGAPGDPEYFRQENDNRE